MANEKKPAAKVGKVKALVLSDSVYGRCGEVCEFDAAEAEAIEAAGYIDTHPNAVKSAEG